MGLLQKAVETYDAHISRVGVEYAEEKEPLAPISHNLVRADLEVTIDRNGRFVEARAVDKNDRKILIPVTEESAGRTSAPCAHPLCDQIKYVAPCDAKRHEQYVTQLASWTNSEYNHPMLPPILEYVTGGTILEDLQSCGLAQKDDSMIRWRVVGAGLSEEACWKNRALHQAFMDWYAHKKRETHQVLCMVSGAQTEPAKQHPKGIIPASGNAKLISSNDDSGFTYRGRFTDDTQAATVGYEVSQKAHSALRWVIANQGTMEGGRMFVCWNPQGKPVPRLPLPLRKKDAIPAATPTDYRNSLQKVLTGYQSELPAEEGVVIAAFDAATTGRLSVTYYNELTGSDFLDRLHDWDDTCCWWNGKFGIQSPGLYELVQCAFGTLRGEKLEVDDRIVGQQIQRLIACRVDRAAFPVDIERALVQKASNLQIYNGSNRAKLLFSACAAVRKYRYDKFKEVWEMALEPEKKDRSYQYGRLLAVLEKAERDTYDSNEGREPNAMRMQAVFSQRPQYAGRFLWEQVKKAYYPRLKPWQRAYYERLIGEIMEQLSQFPEQEMNQALGDTYLLGYYLQKNDLYTSKKKQEQETEEE